jgi:hypothetical protein
MTALLPLERTQDGWLVTYSVQTASSATDVSGPFATRDQAERARASVAAAMPDVRVVRRGTCAVEPGDDPAPRLARACTSWARMLPKDCAARPFLEVIPPAAERTAPAGPAEHPASRHLAKAETLAELLASMAHDGNASLSPATLASVCSSLFHELTEVRAGLDQSRPRGDV